MSLRHVPDDTPLELIDGYIEVIRKFNPDLFNPREKTSVYPEIVKRYPIKTEKTPIDGNKLIHLEQFMVDLFEQSHNLNMMVNAMELTKELGLTRAAKVINSDIIRDDLLRKG